MSLPKRVCLVVHGISDVVPGDTARRVAVLAADGPATELRVRSGDHETHGWLADVQGEPVAFLDGAWADQSSSPRGPLGVLSVAWIHVVRLPALSVREARASGREGLALALEAFAYPLAVLLPGVLASLLLCLLVLLMPAYVSATLAVVVGLIAAWWFEDRAQPSLFGTVLVGGVVGAAVLGAAAWVTASPETMALGASGTGTLASLGVPVRPAALAVAVLATLPAGAIVTWKSHGWFRAAVEHPGAFEHEDPERAAGTRVSKRPRGWRLAVFAALVAGLVSAVAVVSAPTRPVAPGDAASWQQMRMHGFGIEVGAPVAVSGPEGAYRLCQGVLCEPAPVVATRAPSLDIVRWAPNTLPTLAPRVDPSADEADEQAGGGLTLDAAFLQPLSLGDRQVFVSQTPRNFLAVQNPDRADRDLEIVSPSRPDDLVFQAGLVVWR
ncbi:MAG: hypothetical protein R3F61_18060 [Myxococcota bacterium]